MAGKITKKMTPEQAAEERLKNSMMHVLDHLDAIPPVTPGRELVPGDAVLIGHLEDAVVEAVHYEGRVVVIDHTSVDNNYGKPIRTPHQKVVRPWHEVVKIADVDAETRLAEEGRNFNSFRSTDLESLLHTILRRGLIDNPDYQRGYVWTPEDKARYLESLFDERDLGKFVFVEYEHPEWRLEVLDGKQRLSTLLGFYLSQIPYRGRYWHQLSNWDRYRVKSRGIQFAQFRSTSMTKVNRLRLFLDLNTAGVPQTEEHLAKVRALYEQAKAEEKAAAEVMP